MITAKAKWVRVSRSRRCPVCGRSDFCTVSADGLACHCQRVASDKPSAGRIGGWIHKVGVPAIAAPAEKKRSYVELRGLMRNYMLAVNASKLLAFAAGLGVTWQSLRRLHIGWAFDQRAWAFPMVGADAKIVGIRLRTVDGKKFSVKGGREGLFMTVTRHGQGPLMICEGPTSMAALLDLGFDAVGRPSCTGAVDMLCKWLMGPPRRDVVILGDRDTAKTAAGHVRYPGQDGAEQLAAAVAKLWRVRSVRVLVPPVKDARDWLRAGATKSDVDAAIAAAGRIK